MARIVKYTIFWLMLMTSAAGGLFYRSTQGCLLSSYKIDVTKNFYLVTAIEIPTIVDSVLMEERVAEFTDEVSTISSAIYKNSEPQIIENNIVEVKKSKKEKVNFEAIDHDVVTIPNSDFKKEMSEIVGADIEKKIVESKKYDEFEISNKHNEHELNQITENNEQSLHQKLEIEEVDLGTLPKDEEWAFETNEIALKNREIAIVDQIELKTNTETEKIEDLSFKLINHFEINDAIKIEQKLLRVTAPAYQWRSSDVLRDSGEISATDKIKAHAVDVLKVSSKNWSKSLEESGVLQQIAKLDEDIRDQKIAKEKVEIAANRLEEDKVIVTQAGQIDADTVDLTSYDQKIEQIEQATVPPPLNVPEAELVGKTAIPQVITPFYSQKVSPSVARAISRELGREVVSSQREYSQPSPAQAPSEYSPIIKEAQNAFVDTQVNEHENTKGITLKPIEYDFNLGQKNTVTDFEAWPSADSNLRLYDNGSGKIQIRKRLNQMGNMGMVVVAPGHIRVRTTIEFLAEDEVVIVPMIQTESLDRFIEKEGVEAKGGLVLVDRSDAVNGVDLNIKYQAKVYLDEKWNVSNDEHGERYVLYVGVETGRSILSYRTTSNEILRKEIWVTEGELYFDYNSIQEESARSVGLRSLSLIGSEAVNLSVNEKDLSYYLTKMVSRKTKQNEYLFSKHARLGGTTDFIKLKDERDEILLGTSAFNERFDVLERSALSNIISNFGIDRLDHGCLIELTVKKRIKTVNVSAEAENGGAEIETKYWAKDGSISDTETSYARKIYFYAEPSLVNYEVKYQDGTLDTNTAICLPNRYMIISN